MHAPRLRTLIISAVFMLPALAGATTTLRDLVEQAWQRSPAGSATVSRRAEMDALRALSASWIAGQPVLGLSQREGRRNGEPGQRESEVSLSAPLWSPSQRSARQELAVLTGAELDAELRKLRLDIAGEVRTRLWDAAAAQARLLELEDDLHHAEDLAGDVERRVRAGDLARVDGLLATQEVLTIKVAVEQAKALASSTQARLRLLTGAAGALPYTPEPIAAAPADDARLLAARATESRAQAALRLAQASRREPATLSLSMRQERSPALRDPERALGVAVQVPLGSAGRNRPAEAQAQTAVAIASAQAQQAEAAIRSELASAQSDLAHAQAALRAASARVDAMREHEQLINKAFKLGERPLADLLRSRALFHEARMAHRQQEVALGRAHALVNQASGVLP